jgi:signal transduction histidine kinase
MRQVVKQLLEAITEIIGAEDASVWLWDKENTGWLVCQTILHAWAGAPHHLRLPPGQGIAGWAAQTGQSAMVSYAPEDYRFFSGIDRQIGFRTASLLAVPLCARDKVIGVLEVVNKFAGAFNDDDCKLAETLAASAAIALDNAELVDALRQHAAELQARNEELDAFAHTVAHDLQNPLGIIVGFARVLQTDYSGLSGQDLLRYLRLIAQNGQKMSNIIDELFLLASVRKREVKTSPLDMARIVAEAQGRLIDLAEQYRPEFVLPEAWPAALGYGPWVEEVWVNYLSNALKYGGRPPRIELGADEVSGTCESATHLMVRFWVRDNGAGLPPEEQARLFTPFTRLDQARARGHGLGLSIVRRIVEKLGGQVGVESAPGAGSTFWFTLPAA